MGGGKGHVQAGGAIGEFLEPAHALGDARLDGIRVVNPVKVNLDGNAQGILHRKPTTVTPHMISPVPHARASGCW